MIEIFPMKEEDIDKVYKIEEKCFITPWSKYSFKKELTSPLTYYVVAKKDNKILAYGGMWIIVGEGHITNIAVDPAYRNQGIGKAVLGSLIEEAERRKLTGVTLEVRESNIEAINLYKNLDLYVQA